MTYENDPNRGGEAPRRRWPRVLLALSLTLNFIVIGLVGGAVLRDEHDTRRFPPPDRGVMQATGFGPFFDAMPRAARNRMGDALRGAEGNFAPDRAVLAAEFSNMLAVLRAEPFDRDAFEALLSAQQARADARIDAGRAMLVDQIGAMTASERGDFADGLERRFDHALERGPGAGPGAGQGRDVGMHRGN